MKVTPEEVRSAYEYTRFIPAKGAYWIPDPDVGGITSCGIYAVLIYRAGVKVHGKDLRDIRLSDLVQWTGLSEEYVHGFASGFDGEKRGSDRDPAFNEGFEDGAQAAKAVTYAGESNEGNAAGSLSDPR